MAAHIKGYVFKGQLVVPPHPRVNSTYKLNDDALMALPFIGRWVGLDELVPSKSVYAIYDPGNAGIRYTFGDGTLVDAEQVCFSTSYKDFNSTLHQAQKKYLEALIHASITYYDMINSGSHQATAAIYRKFSSPEAVKSALIYYFDASTNHNKCPALNDRPAGDEQQFENMDPMVNVYSEPFWNFDPSGFQAYAPQNISESFTALFVDFQKKYRSKLSLVEFQHATYCLAGLEKANLVPFVVEGQNDSRLHLPGQTQMLPLRLQIPLTTTSGWTVDCFVARFGHFTSEFVRSKFIKYPNPILWLEAELEAEAILSARSDAYEKKKPWKGQLSNVDVNGVITWELLKALRWETRGEFDQYPKPYYSKVCMLFSVFIFCLLAIGISIFTATGCDREGCGFKGGL